MNAEIETRRSIAERILDCFPAGSYALGALLGLLEIVETTETETAAVECRAEPRMLVNPEFADRWADTPEKLLMLVMHELHHILLGHTRFFPCVTPVDNLVFDAVINSMLCRMFPEPEHIRFFTDFYDEKAFPACLLRPPNGWNPKSIAPVPRGLREPRYERLMGDYKILYSERGASYEELYEDLRSLVSQEAAAGVPLIGDHSGDMNSSTAGGLENRSPVVFEAVRRIVERWPQPPNPIAGRSLADLIAQSSLRVARPRSTREVLRGLLQKVGGRSHGGGQIRVVDDDSTVIESPLPGFDRRSAVLTALGARPLLHPHALAVKRPRLVGKRVHIYLDVSGSIGDLKGPLYGAVLDCKDFVHPRIHLFSTEVADITLDELRRGVCRTTGGTDISCVAKHMRENRVRRAAVITDGYVGKPAGQNHETLTKAKLGIALTPGGSTRADLEEVADWLVELPNREVSGGN